MAFDIILNEDGNTELTFTETPSKSTDSSTGNVSAKLILPKLQPLKKPSEEDTELLKRRIMEKEMQAALNRQNELAKIQNKSSLQEEKSRRVWEKKKLLEESGEGVEEGDEMRGSHGSGSLVNNSRGSVRGQ